MCNLYYFDYEEFREWRDIMSPRLIVTLDIFRHLIESPIYISSHPSSLGRRLGASSMSAHNVDVWGEVLAVDCFIERAKTRQDVSDVIECAKMLGFTGIGIYPEWVNDQGKIQCGFHLDVRPTKRMGDPATWGFLKGEFTSIEKALAKLDGRSDISVDYGRGVKRT